MGQFVEDHRREIRLALREHGAQQRIARPPQRRICGDARYMDVQPLRPQLRRELNRSLLRKISPVWNAAIDRKAPGAEHQREFRGGENRPGDGFLPHIDIAAVAVIVGQRQFVDGKLPDRLRILHLGAQGFRGRRIVDKPCHALSRSHDFDMTLQRLRKIGRTGAACDARHQERGKDQPEQSVHG